MNKRFLRLALTVLTGLLLTACGNDSQPDAPVKEEKQSAATFSINITSYNDEEEITRSSKLEETQRQAIDLGNGLEAELSIERDTMQSNTHAAQTRAAMPNQHYTIYAMQGGSRVGDVLKGTVSGSGTSQHFTPDAGYKDRLLLPAGTYTFVCYNDKVSDDGTRLSVTRANAGTALIGTTTATISGVRYNVHFVMKHQAARVRVKMMTYWPIQNIKGSLQGNNVNELATYQADPTATPTYSAPATFNEALTYPDDLVEEPYGTGENGREYGRYYSETQNYQYVLPNTNANQLSLKFTSGELYRDPQHHSKSLVGYLHNITTSKPLLANGSYVLRVDIYYKANYLFEDGVVRTYVNRGTHTPIAAVLKDNDGTAHSGTAIALLIAAEQNWSTTYPQQDTPTMTTNFTTHAAAMDGESQTWSNFYTPDGTIKALSTKYPAFYYGANLFDSRDATGQMTTRLGANLSRWYIPSFGEWKLAAHVLGYLDLSNVNDWGDYTNGWDYQMYKVFFLQAGGQYFPVNYSWATAETTDSYAGWAANTETQGFRFGWTGKFNTLFIHPFIHF